MSEELIEHPLIDNARALETLIGKLTDTRLVALDTEFIRERTFYPELCLLQIATDDFVVAVDCLADIDLDPLFEVLLTEDKAWLLHSARQDLEVLFNRTGRLPRKLIDTQIAASLVGMPIQVGLQGLLENTLEIEIGKQHTRANWKRRPLPGEFLKYALDDVRFLIPALRRLESQLAALGRTSWFEEECARQLAIPIEPDIQTIFERTRGTGRLRGRQRGAAMELVAWREERAKSRNRPRRWILADDQLVRLAAALPATKADLDRIPDLPPRLVSRSGSRLVAVISNAKDLNDVADLPAPDKAVVRSLQTEIKARAQALGIQPELLATRKDVAMLAAGRVPESLSSGWRRTALSETLDALS